MCVRDISSTIIDRFNSPWQKSYMWNWVQLVTFGIERRLRYMQLSVFCTWTNRHIHTTCVTCNGVLTWWWFGFRRHQPTNTASYTQHRLMCVVHVCRRTHQSSAGCNSSIDVINHHPSPITIIMVSATIQHNRFVIIFIVEWKLWDFVIGGLYAYVFRAIYRCIGLLDGWCCGWCVLIFFDGWWSSGKWLELLLAKLNRGVQCQKV